MIPVWEIHPERATKQCCCGDNFLPLLHELDIVTLPVTGLVRVHNFRLSIFVCARLAEESLLCPVTIHFLFPRGNSFFSIMLFSVTFSNGCRGLYLGWILHWTVTISEPVIHTVVAPTFLDCIVTLSNIVSVKNVCNMFLFIICMVCFCSRSASCCSHCSNA